MDERYQAAALEFQPLEQAILNFKEDLICSFKTTKTMCYEHNKLLRSILNFNQSDQEDYGKKVIDIAESEIEKEALLEWASTYFEPVHLPTIIFHI